MPLSLVSIGPNGVKKLHPVLNPEEAVAKYKELEAAGYRVVIQDGDGRPKHNGKDW